VLFDPVQGKPAAVGCCAEIIQYQRLPDGWGIDPGAATVSGFGVRARKPYKVGLVEWIEDYPPQQDLRSLARVETTSRCSASDSKITDQNIELPENIPDLLQSCLTGWQSNLYGVAAEQQALLEMRIPLPD